MKETLQVVSALSHNFTRIIPREELDSYPPLSLGKNGVGSR